MFPSPIGELHFSIISTFLLTISVNVSVPYRGATFLNGEDDLKKNLDKGFRPLSGSYISQWLCGVLPVGNLI